MTLSLGRWLGERTSRPPRDPEGRMTLTEHLRELRNRLFKAVAAILVVMVAAWFFYDPLFNLLREPIDQAIAHLQAERQVDIKLVIGDVTGALMLKLKICLVAGLIVACPVWLYQIWAFIVPGMRATERKWSLSFLGTAAPLFVAGVVVGYLAMPKGLGVLFDFTPMHVSNYPQLSVYLNFTLRLLLVFGLAFEIPVFVILLNLVGVLSVARLKKWRAPIIFCIFVFAAIATPSTDPVTMLLLAAPMTLLFVASELVARVFEARKRARLAAQGIDLSLPDDEDDEGS